MFDKRETAAILAGLRLLQLALTPDENLATRVAKRGFMTTARDIRDWIYTDSDSLKGLDAKEIDALCERINCGDKRTLYAVVHTHRFGTDLYLHLGTHHPSAADLIGENWEPDRQDEYYDEFWFVPHEIKRD